MYKYPLPNYIFIILIMVYYSQISLYLPLNYIFPLNKHQIYFNQVNDFLLSAFYLNL